jgi:hypothetical protein
MALVPFGERVPRLERANLAQPSVGSPAVRIGLALSVCDQVTAELLAFQSAHSAVGEVELLGTKASVLA